MATPKGLKLVTHSDVSDQRNQQVNIRIDGYLPPTFDFNGKHANLNFHQEQSVPAFAGGSQFTVVMIEKKDQKGKVYVRVVDYASMIAWEDKKDGFGEQPIYSGFTNLLSRDEKEPSVPSEKVFEIDQDEAILLIVRGHFDTDHVASITETAIEYTVYIDKESEYKKAINAESQKDYFKRDSFYDIILGTVAFVEDKDKNKIPVLTQHYDSRKNLDWSQHCIITIPLFRYNQSRQNEGEA